VSRTWLPFCLALTACGSRPPPGADLGVPDGAPPPRHDGIRWPDSAVGCCDLRADLPRAGDLDPCPSGSWSCGAGPCNAQICTRTDPTVLPSHTGTWTCSRTLKNATAIWVCYGSAGATVAGCGWSCAPAADPVLGWRCERPERASDQPPGGGVWACLMGSAHGGLWCEKIADGPQPPPPPKPGDQCCPGQKMWCDGLMYSGWGTVACDPATQKWKTKVQNGKATLDCQESADGRRPDTLCACYHFFFNPTCCERADCILPATTSGGQVCPPSQGQLCSYCNPQKPECVEAGAKCIVTNAHETFCGRLCTDGQPPCPSGFSCMVVKLAGGASTKQCVPSDFSCYY
jgi:hypothetical protein